MAKQRGKGIDNTDEGVEPKKAKHVLRLYVAGTSRRSLRAIENLKRVLKEDLKGEYDLEIIDIYQQPIFAKRSQIVAAPTLVKELPPPLQRFIGDLSDTERLLAALEIVPHEDK